MKTAALAITASLFLIFFAVQASAEVRNIDFVDDPLGNCTSADSIDSCMGLGTMTILVCKDSYGCPMCSMNNDLTKAICFRLNGNFGFCTCKPIGTYRDQFGNLQPNCTVQGSCSVR
jgi:hypothetical protein